MVSKCRRCSSKVVLVRVYYYVAHISYTTIPLQLRQHEVCLLDTPAVNSSDQTDISSIEIGLLEFGAWGLKSALVFSFVSRAVALHRNLDEERSDTYLRQAVCETLQRYNANTLLKHRNPLTPTADGPVSTDDKE